MYKNKKIMKEKLVVLFLMISYIGFGQGLNSELSFNNDFSQTPTALICENEFTYMVEFRKYSSSFFSLSYLNKIDTIGNIIWSSQISPMFAEIILIHKILPSEDGGVYLIGFAMPTCDVDDTYWFVQKYNSVGTSEWSKVWYDQNFYEKRLSGISMTSSNRLCVDYLSSNGSTVFYFDSLGLTSDSLSIPVSNIEGFEDISAYEIIGFKQDTLFGFDSLGAISKSILFNTPIQNIKTLDDTLFILTRDSVFKFDNNLQYILGTNINGYSNYSNLKFLNGSIQFISSSSTTQNIINLNHQFQYISDLAIPVNLDSKAIKDFSQYHFSSAFEFPLAEYKSIRYLDFSLNSTANAIINTTDIGVIDVIPVSTTAVEVQNQPNVYTISIEANILIKNSGAKVLNSCRLNHVVHSWGICNPSVYSEDFAGLNLNPGDSLLISAGFIHIETNYFGGDSINRNICVYTSHPNQLSDLNLTNDELCKRIHIGMVGIDEVENQEISIFPNPTNGIINVQLPNEKDAFYSIIDLHGKILLSGKIESGDINISALSNGMYFIKISIDDYQVEIVKKIIKQVF